MLIVALVVAGLVIMVLAFLAGIVVGTAHKMANDVKRDLRRLRMTKEDVVLYRKGAKILNRLINVTDLDGDLATDIVSEKTRATIVEWVDEYNKELDKV